MAKHVFGHVVVALVVALASCCQGAGEDSQENAATCCGSILVSAREAIEAEQGALLGRYDLNGTLSGKPVYLRTVADFQFYFFYKENGTYGSDSPGWMLGPDLTGDSVNIATRNTAADCPSDHMAIVGAYDRDQTLDSSFRVVCLEPAESAAQSESAACACTSMWANATDVAGPIHKNHGLLLGQYERIDRQINGYPVFNLQQFGFNFYLYHSKTGRRSDGWVIGELENPDVFYITTRSSAACPDRISPGFDRDLEEDKSFFLACEDALSPAAASSASSASPKSVSVRNSSLFTIVLLASGWLFRE